MKAKNIKKRIHATSKRGPVKSNELASKKRKMSRRQNNTLQIKKAKRLNTGIKSVKTAKKYQKHRSRYSEAVSLEQNQVPFSYKDAVIKGILTSNSAEYGTNEESILLSHLLVNLESGPNEVYKSGVTAGKLAYYSLFGNSKPKWYEDALPKLIAFFESAGYKKISYDALGVSGPVLRIGDSKGIQLGANIHYFEAGIISGFISSARGEYVPITESECRNNGFYQCKFIVSRPKFKKLREKSAIQKLVGGAIASSSTKKQFSSLYNAMIFAPLPHNARSEARIFRIGSIAKNQFMEKSKGLLSEEEMLGKSLEMFVSCKIGYDKNNNIAEISFDPWNSNNVYISQVKSFIEGFIGVCGILKLATSESGLSYSLKLIKPVKLLKANNK